MWVAGGARVSLGRSERFSGRLQVPEAPPEPSGVESTLAERAGMYRTAIANARQAGDGSRVRRYERGLKVSRNHAPEGSGALAQSPRFPRIFN
ncbi:hypothetical protein QYF61_022182 [Mycteria americana]|uniref:DM14 domain-containing protein n=1 Tax=Mycteria americana TaxID=33587 RepID=A0AAN7MHN8_MYCAM|nr:hypothetical protein QYF61_022182 [Mycteria americana]